MIYMLDISLCAVLISNDESRPNQRLEWDSGATKDNLGVKRYSGYWQGYQPNTTSLTDNLHWQ